MTEQRWDRRRSLLRDLLGFRLLWPGTILHLGAATARRRGADSVGRR